ncbi:MAG: hypothetical protein IPG45_28730 [Deltaproteobacteria bacterium]|jgi:hypothetical protein|nr:hypothetical protein [Deltaproteobacteria bacterium]
MADFILLMHRDQTRAETDEAWGEYFGKLRSRGAFQGGSSIGDGVALRKSGAPAPLTQQLVGFIRVRADDLADAQGLVAGNPVYEAGGTVEVRELPPD